VHSTRPAAALDRATLLLWQTSIGTRAPATRKAYLCTVQAFCRWLHEEGHVEADPAARLVRPSVPRHVPRALPGTEVEAVLAACRDSRERLVVWLEVGCGLRAAEVSGLDLADFDPAQQTLWVRGKFGHERVVPVPAEVLQALDAYLSVRGLRAGPLVQATDRNRQRPDRRVSPARLSKLVAARMADAGVHRRAWDRKTGHALRHTCARDVLDACRDLPMVQQMLGHRSLATTGIYLGVADLGRLRMAMQGRSYRERAPTICGDGSPLGGAPSTGALSPAAGGPTEKAQPRSA
jgi:integrase